MVYTRLTLKVIERGVITVIVGLGFWAYGFWARGQGLGVGVWVWV